jgi:hypothetical protein
MSISCNVQYLLVLKHEFLLSVLEWKSGFIRTVILLDMFSCKIIRYYRTWSCVHIADVTVPLLQSQYIF